MDFIICFQNSGNIKQCRKCHVSKKKHFKELIENSLDANSTVIEITCTNGGLDLLTVTDDGHGISPQDLPLAARRFATSKLTTFEDLKSIRTFGFRGEALASASMVSRLSILSKCRSSDRKCAYKMSYIDGIPTTADAVPHAGNYGTVIKVEDLFYNVPQRRRAFIPPKNSTSKKKHTSEEYARVLRVCQCYAVHMAQRRVSFSCRKGKGGIADLNTRLIFGDARRNAEGKEEDKKDSLVWTKEAIGSIFGLHIMRELVDLSCSKGNVDEVEAAMLSAIIAASRCNENNSCTRDPYELIFAQEQDDKDNANATSPTAHAHQHFAFDARGFITNASQTSSTFASNNNKNSHYFILFINNRLVESTSLRRSIEAVYADMLGRHQRNRTTRPPFIYLSIRVPGPHVDVNVHPTKREVALLYEDELCECVATAVRQLLGSEEAESRTFYVNSSACENPNKRKQLLLFPKKEEEEEEAKKRKQNEDEKNAFSGANESDPCVIKKKKLSSASSKPVSKEEGAHKRFVRTSQAAPQGALEPYLVNNRVSTPSLLPSSSKKESLPSSASKGSLSSQQIDKNFVKQFIKHAPDCPMASSFPSSSSSIIDMSVPGAFAKVCRCMINNPQHIGSNDGNNNPMPARIQKVDTSDCAYTSIGNLRQTIIDDTNNEYTMKLRECTFVGCVSRQRSLVQYGIELIMIQHNHLARTLFYQLALLQFGCLPCASVGDGGIDVCSLIYEVLTKNTSNNDIVREEVEHDRDFMKDNYRDSTSLGMAQQACACLKDNMEMLMEYFSISLETRENDDALLLKGLPMLLRNDFKPSPHALPLFLFRLATEVNYEDEQICFENISYELGNFFADVPFSDDDDDEEGNRGVLVDPAAEKIIQHSIIPAICNLLMVPNRFVSDGTIVKLAQIPSLYRIFERC